MQCVHSESAPPVSDVCSSPASSLQNVEPASNTSSSTPASLIPVSAQSTSRNTASTTPEDLMPFPKAGPRKGRRARERMKSQILTDTPVRDKMRQAQEKRRKRTSSVQKSTSSKVRATKTTKKPTRKRANSTVSSVERNSYSQIRSVDVERAVSGSGSPCVPKTTIVESDIHTPCRSCRPKRICKRMFSLAEAIQAIQTDDSDILSDISE